MKSCPRCGFSNDDSAKFCKQCGEKLDILQKESMNTCPHCGKEFPKEALFCKYCGTPVEQMQKQEIKLDSKSDPSTKQTFMDNSNNRSTRDLTSLNQLQQATSKSKGNVPNVHLFAFGLCLAIIVIVFVAFIALSSTGPTNNAARRNDSPDYVDENNSYNDYDYNSSSDTINNNYNEKVQDNSVEPEAETTVQETETSEYILPTSDSEYLTKEDLVGLTAGECRLARNEIYARHGRMFLDEELQSYFNSFDWYHPTIEPDDFQESMLNQYEIANRDLIVTYETEQGYR